MPAAQVATLYSVRLYNELRDEVLKWYYVPYDQARPHLEKAIDRVEQLGRQQREILPLASSTLPPMLRARDTLVRADREVALWRVVEALRMYGAGHQSRLPETLNEITEVAIPSDPVTGELFRYSLRGDTALIEGPPLPDAPLTVEIRFAK
jgi:hypothetical protein